MKKNPGSAGSEILGIMGAKPLGDVKNNKVDMYKVMQPSRGFEERIPRSPFFDAAF
jgi:predicted CoA-binding protein